MSEVIYKPTNDFWAGVYPQGMTANNITCELQDMVTMMDGLPAVYDHVTGGKVSIPLTHKDIVISLHDDRVSEIVREHEKEVRNEIIEECVALIQAQTSFPGARTTYDQQLAEHVRNELAKAIKDHFAVK